MHKSLEPTMYLSLFLILTNAIHKKQRNAFAYLRNLRNVLPWIHLLHRQLTILSHKQNKKLLRNFNAMQFSPEPNREEKRKKKKKNNAYFEKIQCIGGHAAFARKTETDLGSLEDPSVEHRSVHQRHVGLLRRSAAHQNGAFEGE